MLFLSHHKCASSLTTLYLRKLCETNQLSLFTTARGDELPSAKHNVNFLVNASYPFLSGRTGPGVHIIRNPLNVVQSAYYSHLRTHPVKNLPILAAQREVLQKCAPGHGKALTAAFCERNDFYPGTPGPLCALRQWNYDDPCFTTVRMEDFGTRIDLALAQGLGEAAASLTWPDPREFTFEAMADGRPPGTVDDSSPYRSGHPDAWRKELPRSVIGFIRAHHRPLLARYYPECLDD